MIGRIHSYESLGALDGPGLRYVVFMQGCPLSCGCCHNPDTSTFEGGEEITPHELYATVEKYRPYFGTEGGITASGGEPLCQAEFLSEVFSLCRDGGITTCLDTSGYMLSETVEKLLDLTDTVLLDIKYSCDEDYVKYTGMSYSAVIDFLKVLDKKGINTVLRRVIIPGLNDKPEDSECLVELSQKYSCVKKVELLPFKKFCTEKYERLGIPFPFAHIPEPDPEAVKKEEARISELIKIS
ncbi:MAG: pyruvate formate lyase-activating protein [Clostridia bacterium]|nr:pyruvate formate lyase-activating protein [Clostridia bacterium]